MDVPNVVRKEYAVIDVSDDGFVTVMSPDGSETKADLRLADFEEGEKIREGFEEGLEINVTTVCAMGNEQIISFKESKE